MKDVVVDIESDSFLETMTKVHCLVIRDVDTDQILASCASPPDDIRDSRPGYKSFAEGLRILEKAERIYGHNLIKFDGPGIKKFLGYEIPWEKQRDTFVIAGMRWTDLKARDGALISKGKLPPAMRGQNSLEAWGFRLGVLKGNFKKSEDPDRFKVWTPEMQSYCEQDTAVNTALVRHIRTVGATPALAIETEQELQEYLDQQEQNGIPFDMEKAVALQAKLSARRQELEEELRKQFKPWFRSRGEFIPKRDNKRQGYVEGVPCTKIELVHFNPGSRQHIADRLQVLYGWNPTEYTDGGQPKVDEETLKSLPQDIPGVKLLIEYLLVVKRLGALAEGDNAWLKAATKDRPEGGKLTGLYHIHHVCLQSGTITHRASHMKPNLGQVPAVDAPFGPECRELFYVPDGWTLVGSDASGLELRELSHYMAAYDGGAYGKTVIEGKSSEGTDIHSVNRDALGLSGSAGRASAKTFI